MEKKTTANEDNTNKIVNFNVCAKKVMRLPYNYCLVMESTVLGLVGRFTSLIFTHTKNNILNYYAK